MAVRTYVTSVQASSCEKVMTVKQFVKQVDVVSNVKARCCEKVVKGSPVRLAGRVHNQPVFWLTILQPVVNPTSKKKPFFVRAAATKTLELVCFVRASATKTLEGFGPVFVYPRPKPSRVLVPFFYRGLLRNTYSHHLYIDSYYLRSSTHLAVWVRSISEVFRSCTRSTSITISLSLSLFRTVDGLKDGRT